MNASETLESDRLHLRRWTEADFDHYAEYYAEAATSQYVGGR